MTIFERVRDLNLPFGEYVVVGSGVLEALGIRSANDVDVVVSEKFFQELVGQGAVICRCEKCEALWRAGGQKKTIKLEGVDILSEYSWDDEYRADTLKLIEDALVIQGIPFVQPRELLRWKRAVGREKDQQDIVLLERYLNTHESTSGFKK